MVLTYLHFRILNFPLIKGLLRSNQPRCSVRISDEGKSRKLVNLLGFSMDFPMKIMGFSMVFRLKLSLKPRLIEYDWPGTGTTGRIFFELGMKLEKKGGYWCRFEIVWDFMPSSSSLAVTHDAFTFHRLPFLMSDLSSWVYLPLESPTCENITGTTSYMTLWSQTWLALTIPELNGVFTNYPPPFCIFLKPFAIVKQLGAPLN